MITTLLQLAALFSVLSLLAFGGGAGVIPDMQRAAVDAHHWVTAREFLDMFAISRATPGPGSLIVVLIGQRAAGLAGGLVAFLAMFGPSCLITYVLARFWHRRAQAPWRALVERALAPVAVGLTFATGIALMRGTESGWLLYAVTLTSTVLFAFTDVSPVALLGVGAATLLLAGS